MNLLGVIFCYRSWTHPISDIDLNLAFDGGIDLSTFQSDYKVINLHDLPESFKMCTERDLQSD